LHGRYARQALVALEIEALKVRETIKDGRRDVDSWLYVGQNQSFCSSDRQRRSQVAQLVVVQIEVPKIGEIVEDGPRQVALTQLVVLQIEVRAGAHVVEHAMAPGGVGPRAVQDTA
jgi:hypothetical protein